MILGRGRWEDQWKFFIFFYFLFVNTPAKSEYQTKVTGEVAKPKMKIHFYVLKRYKLILKYFQWFPYLPLPKGGATLQLR